MNTLVPKVTLPLIIAISTHAWALSPPNLTSNINWIDTGGSGNTATYNGVIDITSAFNRGRRQEEIQLGIATNSLGTLDLPSQANWNLMTDDAKALLILNDERQDRAGMQPGVIGLPLAGIESHIDNIAKKYGDLLHDTDTTGHSQPSGNPNIDSPFIRIEQDMDIGEQAGCFEFLARAENLAYFATTGNSIPLPLERALYGFIYDDAGSAWGHREAAFLQDETLAQVGSQWGFLNNNTDAASEGYLGIYVRSSADYKPFSSFASNYGSVVVMNIFDPVSTSTNCHYNTTLSHTETTSAQGQVPTFNLPNNQWVQIGLNTQAATGSTVNTLLGDDITGTYATDWVVYSYLTSTNTYKKLSLTDTMQSGVGYWLIQITGTPITLDMPNSSSGVIVTHSTPCPSTQGCFEIPLQANLSGNQWQMVGTPFRDNRAMGGLKIVTDSGACSAGCTLSEAATEGLTADRLWHYQGSVYEELHLGGTELFEPWDGAWIAVLDGANGLNPKLLIPAAN